MSDKWCRYSSLYEDADKSYLVNFGSRNLRPIRISLPSPPPVHLIDGWGIHPDEQVFKRLKTPKKLKTLEEDVLREFSKTNKGVNGTNVLREFWERLERNQSRFKEEIQFIKNFIWFSYYGYWVYIDGKPTYLPAWYFTYLNNHRMSTDNGYRYPEYREKGRRRFLFREYSFTTTETFADIDKEKRTAYKVEDENGNMRYRMVDTEQRVSFGTIEPKDRRGGLTNESCHIINRQATSQRGADKLCTIVSMGGENADTHFRKKLVPAWSSWQLWLRPIWVGGFGKLKTLEFTSNMLSQIDTLDTSIFATESADDLANDGKMIIGALFDEQGKGKRTGNVQTRWQVNKETMSLAGGSKIIGFCTHPSTVEKMAEGGQDYKDMCDISNFYERKKDGQTVSGLFLCYMPSSFCMEEYIDCFGQAVLDKPTERQIRLGYKKRTGGKEFIKNKRADLYVKDDPKKMDEFRSFVRKYPEDYDECWTGVAGQLGLDNEKIRARVVQLINKPLTVRGEFKWVNKERLEVDFEPRKDGRWIVNKMLPQNERNLVTTMEDYSAFEGDDILVNRPVNPMRFMMGVDPQRFSNQAESKYLKAKNTKKSDTSIVIKQRRDETIDTTNKEHEWITPHCVAAFRERLATSKDAAEEAIKAAVYYGALINIETNITEVWERIVEMRFGGYLNYEILGNAGGDFRRAPKPGTNLATGSKKTGFALLADYIDLHAHIEPILEMLKEADEISSMEQLTMYDMLAAFIQCLIGETSPWAKFMHFDFNEDETIETLGAKSYNY